MNQFLILIVNQVYQYECCTLAVGFSHAQCSVVGKWLRWLVDLESGTPTCKYRHTGLSRFVRQCSSEDSAEIIMSEVPLAEREWSCNAV